MNKHQTIKGSYYVAKRSNTAITKTQINPPLSFGEGPGVRFFTFLFLLLSLGCNLAYAQNKLWGMTYGGGANNNGTIFNTDVSGNNHTVKYSFATTANGSLPYGSLIQASDGNLYGMTTSGGTTNNGVLFQYNPTTSTYTKKLDFAGTTNGDAPQGSLIQASDGNLYGMTSGGGANSLGVLFQYNPTTSTYTKKLDFAGTTNGSYPRGSLMQALDGNLYGMTYQGGANNYGVLFQYNPTTSTYTKKLDFAGATNGRYTQGSLIQASDGNLYGMTQLGGVNDFGVLFQYNPTTSTYTKKFDFDGTTNGRNPFGSLMQASDGNLYGMTYLGGVYDYGVLFQYNPTTSTYTKKLDFDINNGRYPQGSLMQSSDGNLYGMTNIGGANNHGVLFQYNPTTSTYTKKLDYNVTNGKNPQLGHLIEYSECTAPTITCPTNQAVNAGASCNAIVTYTETTTGTAPVAITYSFTGATINSGTGNGSGSTFNKGTTTVTLTATNACGNQSCSFNVVVNDVTAPTITCPSNITVSANNTGCTYVGTIGTATVTDNCSNPDITGPFPTGPYTVGTTTVTWIAIDGSSNTASCTQTVTVVNTLTAVASGSNVSCIGGSNGTATASASGGSATFSKTYQMKSANLTNPGFNIGCPSNTRAYGLSLTGPDYGFFWLDQLPVSSTVTSIALESNFYMNCNGSNPRLVNLNNNASGTISLIGTSCSGCLSPAAVNSGIQNGGIPYYNVGGSNTMKIILSSVNFEGLISNPAWSATENVYAQIHVGASLPVTYSWNTSPVQTTATATGLTTGTYTVTITDFNGCTAISSATVGIAVDATPPVITCPANITVNTNNAVCTYIGTIGTATVTDNCGNPDITGPFPPGPYSIGTTTVTWIAIDASGNTASCTQSVTVVDNQVPTITCPINKTVNADAGVCYATNVTLGSPAVNDNCTGSTSVARLSGNVVSGATQFVLGSNTVTWTATDATGNTSACSQTVTVIDNQPPTINCPAATTVSVNYAGCTNNGSFGTATTTDNCSSTVSRTPSGNLPLGTTVVTWTATDPSGNTANCTQSVTVVSPIIAITSTISNVACKNGTIGAIDISVTGGNLPLTYWWNTTEVTQDISNLNAGVYTVVVTDAFGCTATASFTITQPATNLMVSTSKTNIRCGGKLTGSATANPTGGGGTYSYLWSTAPPKTTATITGLAAGTYTVTVTDNLGCSKTKSVTITQNALLSVIALPSGNTATASATGGVTPYSYSWNTVPVQTNAMATGLSPGNYKVKVTDNLNCTATTTVPVTGSRQQANGNSEASIALYPNPTTGIVNLVTTCSNCDYVDVKIYNAIGDMVLNEKRNMQQLQFDVSHYPTGIYLFDVMAGDVRKTIKVVVE